MVKVSRKFLATFLGIVLALSMVPAMGLSAFAAESVEASSNGAGEVITSQIGTTTWTLQDGVLTIAPTNGVSGELPSTSWEDGQIGGYTSESGWRESFGNANKIVFTGNITFNKSSSDAFTDYRNVTSVVSQGNTAVEFQESASAVCMFRNNLMLTDISSLSSWNTSQVTTMAMMFYGCSALSDFSPLSNWDTSKVESMRLMFYQCAHLTDLSPLSAWDTSQVTTMEVMFSGCSSLSDLSPLSGWDTSKVSWMYRMFQDCSSLSDLSPLSGWNTSQVTRVDGMFSQCTRITDLSPLSGWNTSQVVFMAMMFSGCSSLSDISPLSSWDISQVNTMVDMFSNCPITTMRFGSKWKFMGDPDIWTPTGGNFTGNWVSSNAANKGPYTTEQLIRNWDPSTMAGTWIAETSDAILPTGVTVSPTSATLTSKGATRQLTATVSPSNATNKTVTWSSSNNGIATVSSSGLVTAVANGTATINVKTVNGKTATATVTVSIPVDVTGVSLNTGAFTLSAKGATKQVTATVLPSNATNKAVTWSSSNTGIATVSSTGLVTAISNGSAMITARTANGKTASVWVTVSYAINPTSVKISQGAFKLTKKSDCKQLTAIVSPANATNKSVTWTSSNKAVAKVSSTGKVTPGGKNGTATITAKTSNGKTAKVKVTVKIVYPTKVTITTNAFTLTSKGATKKVGYKLSGSGITDKTVTWSSSNSKIATVSPSGKVVAVANGTATITAKTANGKKDTVKVTVKIPTPKPPTPITSKKMNSRELEVAKDIFNQYNAFRRSKGLKAATWSGDCSDMAYNSAVRCDKLGSLKHRLGIPESKQKSYSDILQYATWQMTGSEAISKWKESAGHRKMMQCNTTTKAGVAAYRNPKSGLWYYAIVYNFKGTNQNGS